MAAQGNLDAGVAGILGVINSNATELLNGLLTITDPELFADSSAKLQAAALGAIVAATGGARRMSWGGAPALAFGGRKDAVQDA